MRCKDYSMISSVHIISFTKFGTHSKGIAWTYLYLDALVCIKLRDAAVYYEVMLSDKERKVSLLSVT